MMRVGSGLEKKIRPGRFAVLQARELFKVTEIENQMHQQSTKLLIMKGFETDSIDIKSVEEIFSLNIHTKNIQNQTYLIAELQFFSSYSTNRVKLCAFPMSYGKIR